MTLLSNDDPDSDTPQRRPTIRQVAALAGVGIKTVSRVINDEPNVSDAMIARVREAAAQLHYQPDLHARTMRKADRKTRTLGLLVGDVANPFSAAVHRAVEEAALQHGVAVFASSLDDDPDRERSAISSLLQRRVDGLILTTVTDTQSYLVADQERGTKLVFIDREPRGIVADAVVSDSYAGARTATQHLIEAGHHRIAYLGDRDGIQTAALRKKGYLDALTAAGYRADSSLVIEGVGNELNAHIATRRLFDSGQPPTAIFTSQNLTTAGALRALHELRLRHKIAHVGFDDLELADLLDPGVTVMAQDASRIGLVAAEHMFARLTGDRSPAELHTIPTRLIVRGSGEIAPS